MDGFDDPQFLEPLAEGEMHLSSYEIVLIQRNAEIRSLNARYEKAVQDELRALTAEQVEKSRRETEIVDNKICLIVLCPFCNAPYTASMLSDLYGYAAGCETCGGAEIEGSIEIYCSNCCRLVYKKEY